MISVFELLDNAKPALASKSFALSSDNSKAIVKANTVFLLGT